MSNPSSQNPNENNDWLEEFLRTHMPAEEIQPDEQALSGSDLVRHEDREFEQIMKETLNGDYDPNGDPENTSEEEPNAPQRKVRPKKKGGYGLFGIPHLISTLIWLVLAISIGVSLGRLLWICATDVLAFGREDKTIYVTITDSDTIDTITDKLYNAGLIQYPKLFKFYANLASADEKISAGTFELNSLYDYHALVGGMSATSSYRQSVEVMSPECYTCSQIFKLLEVKGVCTAEKLEKYSEESEFADYWFLEGVERGNKYTLEGFLFPDTYEFYTNATPKQVFIKFLDRFEDQLDDDIENLLKDLNDRLTSMMKKNGYGTTYIEDHLMTLYDVIKVASMIEKESAHTGENYNVSSVIYNRLTNEKSFPYLQIDATIVYALGGKSSLTEEDLKLDSPYNSYLNSGLPPTPISNPGLSSILSALSPAETGYYYYALDPSTGEHHFSKTLAEHNQFLNSLKK